MKFSLLKDLKDLSNKDCSLPSRLISYSFPSLTPSITCHQLYSHTGASLPLLKLLPA